MSTYWYGACHDCKQYVELSNAGSNNAKQMLDDWARRFGHQGHKMQFSTEYDDVFMDRIRRGLESGKYLGFGCYEQKQIDDGYQEVTEQLDQEDTGNE